MGAGASVLDDPYSETATLPNSRLFAPVVDMFLEVEDLKDKAARCDANIIHDTLGQMYIAHSALIDTVLIHQKAQLLRLARHFNGFDPAITIAEECKTRLSGPYGEFIRHSLMKFSDIRLELMSVAMSGLGCDEELIVEVVCLCDQEALRLLRLDVAMNAHKGVSKGKLIGKTKKDSCLQKFLLRALEESREEEGPADIGLARAQMMMLHDIATSKSRNAMQYLDVIMNCSRNQCAAIAEAYKKEHNFTLEASITSVFRGLCGRAVTLWTMPLLEAVAMEMRCVMDDTTFRDGEDTVLSVARLVSCRDKHELVEIEEIYMRENGETLISVLDHFAYGNIRAAIYRRMENNYLDEGAEVRMNAYVKQNGGTMYSTFVDGHSIATMAGFMMEMKAKYAAYLSKRDVVSTAAVAHISQKTIDMPHVSAKEFGAKRYSSTRTFSAAERGKYKDNFAIMFEVLRGQFIKHDFDRSGALDSVEFWTMMSNLNLGLSAKDIEEMKQRNDWDKDGFVSFEEASHELIDTIMATFEAQGKDIKEEVNRLQIAVAEEEQLQPCLSKDSMKDEALPPKLPKYLKASFEAFDADKSGFLDKLEFWNFMRSIFTDAFTDYDIEEMQVSFNKYIHQIVMYNNCAYGQKSFDLNGDGEITWNEAASNIYSLTKEMKSGNRDVWVNFLLFVSIYEKR